MVIVGQALVRVGFDDGIYLPIDVPREGNTLCLVLIASKAFATLGERAGETENISTVWLEGFTQPL